MKFSEIAESKGYKNFMAKLYGIGASVVMIGALFKLTHVDFYNLGLPNIMLTLGLVTEAIIFLFSAFEPLHVEPDWSLVYPELWDLYHGDGSSKAEKPAAGAKTNTNTSNGDIITNKLNEMFEKANINSVTMERLSAGLNKLGENASKIADVTDAVTATNNYTKAMAKASETVNALDEQMTKSATGTAVYNDTNRKLNDSMALYIEQVNAASSNTEAMNKHMQDMTKRMTAMQSIYGKMISEIAMNIKA